MSESSLQLFHFAEPLWLSLFLVIPVVFLLYMKWFSNSSANSDLKQLESFADKELIPHLLVNNRRKGDASDSVIFSLLLWSVLWSLMILAMAGPRWSYREYDTYSTERSLVILLDLSESMKGDDVRPSRLSRARQEIEDVVKLLSKGDSKVRIGLAAFAHDGHLVSPVTEDPSNLLRLLPHLSTEMIYLQGTKLSAAFALAERMLANEGAKNRTILVVSDGGFQDNDAFKKASELAASGIQVHTIGVGTKKGMFLNGPNGRIKKNGKDVISRLEDERLQQIAKLGQGSYHEMHYSDRNSKALLKSIEQRSQELSATSKQTRYWDERFYLFLLPVMLLLFFWFRKGLIFPVMIFILIYPTSASAVNLLDRFLNNDENYAIKAVEDEEYDEALEHLDDPYRRGVAQYRAGNYDAAEQEFSRNERKEVEVDALYNLANSQAKQEKFQEAVDTYDKVLELDENHEAAAHNKSIVERLLMLHETVRPKQQNRKQPPSNDNNLQDGGGGSSGGSDDDEEENSDDGDESSEDSGDTSQDKIDKDKQDTGDEEGSEADEQEVDEENDQSQAGDQDEQEDDGDSSASEGKDSDSSQDQSDGGEDESPISREDAEKIDGIGNDPVEFLKNQFYLESVKQNRGKSIESVDPW